MQKYGGGHERKKTALMLFLGVGLLLAGCGEDNAQGAQESNLRQPQGWQESAWEQMQTAGAEDEVFWTPQADAEDGLQRALTSAVKIEAGRWSGSGVVYEKTEEGLVIVTAAHVLAAAGDQVKVSFYDGWEAECAEYQIFEATDCAFLRVPDTALPQDYREKYVTAQRDRERFDAMEGGMNIFLADPGNENGFGYRFALLSESWIYVEDFGQYMMLLSGEASAGMSGSGAYDEFGCFLGILCGKGEENDLAVLPCNIVDAMYQQFISQQ